MKYDVLILGGGPGGYVAAIRAAQLGKKTAVIENRAIGGTCLNRGCIPTKAILSSAEVFENLLHAEDFGLSAENISFDLEKINKRKEDVVSRLVKGIEFVMKKRDIDIIRGEGKITGENEITVNDEKYTGEKMIIASGSEPLELSFLGIDHKRVITSDDALKLTEYPKEIVIIGGGVVGIEFAAIFNSFGSKVTIVEMLDNILMPVDSEIRKKFTITLKKRKIKILTSSKVEKIDKNEEKIVLSLDNGKKLETDMVLVSIGRKLNTDNIGLENIDIEMNGKAVKTNGYMQTSKPHIYAIGDITGDWQLAHAASKQGVIAAEHIAGVETEPIETFFVPSCIFSHPEISWIGLTEDEAKEKGIEYKVGKFPFMANGKALGMNAKDGMVKIIADENNRIIGGHVFGPHASDLIMELAAAVQNGLKVEDIAETIHPHPTLSECIAESAESILGKMIHGV